MKDLDYIWSNSPVVCAINIYILSQIFQQVALHTLINHQFKYSDLPSSIKVDYIQHESPNLAICYKKDQKKIPYLWESKVYKIINPSAHTVQK